jgi:hypothetical protein
VAVGKVMLNDRGSPSKDHWLVAVNVANSGYASAEVPITVRTDSTSVTERLMVPARGKAVQRRFVNRVAQSEPASARSLAASSGRPT